MIDSIAHVAGKHFGQGTKPHKLFPSGNTFRRSLILIVATAAFVWLCGAPRFVGRVQAGSGGGGGGCTAGLNQYSYDAAGRLSQVEIGCSTVITYTYDAVGNLLSVSP